VSFLLLSFGRFLGFWIICGFGVESRSRFLERDTDFAPAGIAPASISDIDWHLCSIP
jgi:hypothetical protein